MSSSSGAPPPPPRVYSIPQATRKTIEDIKEITGKHSDDDIYAMLKECHMDPNETTQRLLYLDTFHEVKKKRDRRKMNVSSRVSDESRWRTGTQGRGFRGGRGHNSSSSFISHGAGGGRNASAQKENGVSTCMERGFKPSLKVPEKTENNANLFIKNSSNISVNGFTSASNGSSSHEHGPPSSADVYSASDPVVVTPPNSRISFVGAIKREVNSTRIVAESDAGKLAGNTVHDVANSKAALEDVTSKTVLKESQLIEKNQPLSPSQLSSLTTSFGSFEVISVQDGQSSQQSIGPSEVVESESSILAVEAGAQSLPGLDVSVLKEAISNLDLKLEKLNISAHQPVIFPDHLQVPEEFKNGLTFGSLDATFDQSVTCANGLEDGTGSILTTESVEGNDEAGSETSPSNLNASSAPGEGDYPDNPHSPPHMLDNLSHLEDNISSKVAPKYDQSKQEVMLPQGGPQYPFVFAPPNYGFPFIQTMPGSQLVQSDGPEPQSGNASTSGSTPTSTQTAGVEQSSVPVSPPPFPVFHPSYPPNYFPYGPYFPPYYLAPNPLQFLGHSGFPQQPSTGNLYLSPVAPVPGVKFSVPQGKPGINAGHLNQFGVPSAYVSHAPTSLVNSGSSAGNEDLGASELKANSAYTTAQQGEGPLVWLPASGRDISSLHANSFYNHLPHGHHVALSPPQAGHGPFAGIYHAEQKTAVASTAHPLLQQSKAMAGSIETVGPPAGRGISTFSP